MELSITLGGGFNYPPSPVATTCVKVLDECGTVGQGAFRSTKPMNLIKLLLLAALIATVIVFFAEGPDLLTIIDQH